MAVTRIGGRCAGSTCPPGISDAAFQAWASGCHGPERYAAFDCVIATPPLRRDRADGRLLRTRRRRFCPSLPVRAAPARTRMSSCVKGSRTMMCTDRWDIGRPPGHPGPCLNSCSAPRTRFGFHDRCAAWSNRLIFDHEWGFYGYDARRHVPAAVRVLRPLVPVHFESVRLGHARGQVRAASRSRRTPSPPTSGRTGTHLPVVRDSGPGDAVRRELSGHRLRRRPADRVHAGQPVSESGEKRHARSQASGTSSSGTSG